MRTIQEAMKKSNKEELEEYPTEEDEAKLSEEICTMVSLKRSKYLDTMASVMCVPVDNTSTFLPFPGQVFNDTLGNMLQWLYENHHRYHNALKNDGIVFVGKGLGSGVFCADITIDNVRSLHINWTRHSHDKYEVDFESRPPKGNCIDTINWAKKHLELMSLLEIVVIRLDDFCRAMDKTAAKERRVRMEEARRQLKELEDYVRH